MTRNSAVPQRVKGGQSVKITPAGNLAARQREVNEIVSRRAYEIYEARDREQGRELEDWVRAESEILLQAPAGFLHSRDFLMVDVDVSGFAARDLELSVEPRRITLSGRRQAICEAGSEVSTSGNSRPLHIFRVIDLPVEVDPLYAVASLKQGVLEVSIAKLRGAQEECATPMAA
ncbi:MAG TPA: DUF2934 domain-containing protein [Terriglobia bacterium]|nr:DUF2934 domain-containing protein [Terriglobia bacterium]